MGETPEYIHHVGRDESLEGRERLVGIYERGCYAGKGSRTETDAAVDITGRFGRQS